MDAPSTGCSEGQTDGIMDRQMDRSNAKCPWPFHGGNIKTKS